MLIAAIYARKSTDQGAVADEAKSVRRQIDHASTYATRKGWAVDDSFVFVDDGISGAEFTARPGYMRLLNALKPRAPFKVLIVSELSRLGREQLETGYAVKQLSQAGVKIFSYLDDRELLVDTPTDKFLMSAVNFAADVEREKARQRTYDAMRRKADAGYLTGGRVFGYDGVREAAGVRRVINPSEAAVIQRIFELALQGHGLTTIAKTLNREQARSPRAQQGRPAGWAPSSVREVLHRPLYRGEIRWNQTRKRNVWGIKHQSARPVAEWVHVPAPELAIVSDAVWEAAHSRMASQRDRYAQSSRGAPPWSREARYLLTGLLTCTACGSGMEARTRRNAGRARSVVYGCSAYARKGTAVCANGLQTPMENADAAVLFALEATLLQPRVIEDAIRRAVERLTTFDDPRENAAEALAQAERELARLSEAIASGGDVPALLAALRRRESQRRTLLAHLAETPEVVRMDAKSIMADLKARVSTWRGLLHDNPSQARGILKQLIVGRLEMTPHREERYYTFSGTGTLLPLVAGVVPQSLASPPGFEPGFQP